MAEKKDTKRVKKKTTPWERVPCYPCPSQCLASRDVKGVHWQLFRTVKGEIKETPKIISLLEKIGMIQPKIEEIIYKLWQGDFSKEIPEEEAQAILAKVRAPTP